ncbi:unnamed protein product [Parascedosporium putredinis]|uniref:Calcium-transporting ATPase n=1 Tax=Parascedosporium putredinis TaxID=1442378 RepID=A0A9P1H3X2_9PEZI|nr:unnamed protein product [Parascedosporium putredinis]CAI7997666.1 unnamed protein product [Parascedosporium putredinis]
MVSDSRGAPTPIWELILEQFKDQLVLILLGSAAVSLDWPSLNKKRAGILTILILNAVVGVSQESSAEKAIAALQEYSANEANVIRNGGHVSRVKAEELVPGDIISIHVGDRIPADCPRVGKDDTIVVSDTKAVLQDQVNMLFSGTTVVTGRAKAVVVLTGSSTAIGGIQESITAQISEPTPLKQKLNDFGDSLAKVITVICVLVWLINIPHFSDPSHGNWTKGAIYYLKIAVSLGVAAIPEGLAVVITTCLALGTRKMAAKNAVTGTLTTNQMSVNKVVYIDESGAGFQELDVEGSTFAPRGDVKINGKVTQDVIQTSSTVRQIAEVAALCNDSHLAYDSRTGNYSLIGEPTEGALRDAGHYASSWHEKQYPRLATYEFSRDRKSMSVLVHDHNKKKLLVKGAPETIIERCSHVLVGSQGKKISLNKKLTDMLLTEVVEYGNRGLRVIALASVDDIVAGSITKCRDAGIRVIVITGDNRNTAESICRKIGVFGCQDCLSLSRVEPGHKSKLVDLLQSLGEVVAMTGDGVNDAPALKKADIGIAMGSGTDVSKLAADMVLADDNFATIEVAIEEGRSIYNNTQQFIRYLISSNIGEVVSIFLTAALGMPEALIPVQLLWVNLVTDGLPATALSFNPPDHDIMRRRPRRRDEALIGGWLFFRYLIIGTYVGLATVAGYAWWFMYNEAGPQITFSQLSRFHRCSTEFPEIGCQMFTNDMAKSASTVSLSILVVIEMFNAMNALSSSESLLTLPLWENMMLVYAIVLSMALHFALLYTPGLQTLFSILPLDLNEWNAVVLISAPVILIDEVLKFFERQFFLQKTTEEPVSVKKTK